MAIKGLPFDSVQYRDEEGHIQEDRKVLSADIADYFGFLSSNGVCVREGEELLDQAKVESLGSEVILNTGSFIIQGRKGTITEPETVSAEAGGTLPRIDSAVIELNTTISERRFIFKLVKGVESNSPTPPPLVREESIYQIGLGNFYREPSSVSLGSFTDTRLDPERCGLASVAIPDITPTTVAAWQQAYPEVVNLDGILQAIALKGLSTLLGGLGSTSIEGALKNLGLEKVPVKLTRDTHNVNANAYAKCVYVKALHMCFFNTSIPPRNNVNYPANTRTTLWNVDPQYLPEVNTALSPQASGSTPMTAYVSTDGGIKVTPKGEALSKGWSLVVSGFWMVKEGSNV